MTEWWRVMPALTLALAGTSSACTPSDHDADAATHDASRADAPALDAYEPAALCDLPEATVGTRLSNQLPSLLFTSCDGTRTERIHDERFCEGEVRFTVVNVAAGWCQPCQEESALLTEELTEPYRDRGVRVVQVLVEDPERYAPTPEFCARWTSTFALVNEVWIDTTRASRPLWPDGTLPATYIVDEGGIVVHRQNATTDGLGSITRALDALLAR